MRVTNLKNGGEFNVSPWKDGWPASQDEGETSLGEAGIQQQATYR
jgi:hypothetical protein